MRFNIITVPDNIQYEKSNILLWSFTLIIITLSAPSPFSAEKKKKVFQEILWLL